MRVLESLNAPLNRQEGTRIVLSPHYFHEVNGFCIFMSADSIAYHHHKRCCFAHPKFYAQKKSNAYSHIEKATPQRDDAN